MPVRICKADQLTPHGRGRKPSAMEHLQEFTDLKIKLAHGLKPFEAVEVELPPSGVKTMRELFKRKVSHYLNSLHLTDYEVQGYRANGKDYVSVANLVQNEGNGKDRSDGGGKERDEDNRHSPSHSPKMA